MANIIVSLYGDYARQFMTAVYPFLSFLIPTYLFALPLKKKLSLPLRLIICLLLYWGIFTAVAIIRTTYDSIAVRIVFRVLSYFWTLIYLFLFIRENPARILLCWSGAVAASEVASHFNSLLLTVAGRNSRQTLSFFHDFVAVRDIPIHFMLIAGCCLLLYYLFGRHDAAEHDSISTRSITILAFVSAVSLALMSSFVSEYAERNHELYIICLATMLSYAIVILFLRSGILAQSKYRAEINVIEEVLTQERKQYEMIRDNIDFINMKCHDIKHQLNELEGRLTNEEIVSLKQAIEIYDSTIKTGNETLDTVLYEKTLLCQEKKIRLSSMADGTALSFMGRTHLYSLFNNALGNAVEAVEKVSDPEKRLISLTIEKDEGVIIDLSNYFEEAPLVEDGKLSTRKADKKHHGLGFRSMKYVTDLYGGAISFDVNDDMFHLTITFPENAERRENTA